MRRVVILITMQLVFTAVCLCQIKIPLADISAAGSPVRMSGTVLFGDSPTMAVRNMYLTDGLVTNVSSKGIVLTIIHISATGLGASGLDDTIAVDRYFGLNNLDPGRDERIDPTAAKFGPLENVRLPPAKAGSDANPSATAQLIFVQFADGSTWGDLDVGRKQLSLRESTLLELRALEKALDEQGELGLKNELSRVGQFQFPAINSLVQSCKNKTAICLTNGLHGMLKEAVLHEAEMKAVPRSALASPK